MWKCTGQGFTFSQHSSGMWCFLVGWVVLGVCKALGSFEMSGKYLPNEIASHRTSMNLQKSRRSCLAKERWSSKACNVVSSGRNKPVFCTQLIILVCRGEKRVQTTLKYRSVYSCLTRCQIPDDGTLCSLSTSGLLDLWLATTVSCSTPR